jgi:integrase
VIDILYRDQDGKKQRYRRDAQVQIKGAAESEARRLLTTIAERGHIPTGTAQESREEDDYSFKDAVDFWAQNNTRKHTTVRGYNVNLDAHLLPRFKDRRLDSFNTEDITKLRKEFENHEPATCNNIEIALRAVLRFAKVNGKLEKMPELLPLRKVAARVITPPRPEDVDLVIRTAYPAAKLAMALAAYAGLRSGEIRGLRFMDIDMARRRIIVRQAVCHGVADVPKSGHERPIPIAEPLYPLLEEACRRKHKATDPVSVSSRGEAWAEGSLLHAFRSVLAKAELPSARVHDLRHFFVTECFRSGAPAPDVQKLAGHLHLHVTQRYAHSSEASQEAAMTAFSARMMDASGRGNSVETEPKKVAPRKRSMRRKRRKSGRSKQVSE